MCIALAAALAGVSCSMGESKEKAAPKRPPVPVKAATAILKDVPILLQAVGTVQPYISVSVKSQVGGYLQKVAFTEGQDVKNGDLLFVIDPRPYQAKLDQLRANLARDNAQLENAKVEVERDEKLLERDFVTREEYDQAVTNAKALEGAVRADRAMIKSAKLDLGYCYIYSPIDGRTGSVLIQKGNLIKANDAGPLVVINQIQPIYVEFSVPAQYFNEIKSLMEAGKLEVEATLPHEGGVTLKGELTFIDNAVDASTGAILLKGTFENPDKSLWPGAFVDVKLRLKTRPNAIVVPSQAVMTSQTGQFVFVIGSDNAVEAREVKTDYRINGESVIDEGLKAGEQVVTDGQLRLSPGATVSIRNTEREEPQPPQ